MEQDNVSKEFAGLVGDEWHEIIRAEYPEFECLCGIVCRNEPTRDLHITNHTPVYDIELIKARIQARSDMDKFLKWHMWELHKFKEPGYGKPAGMIWILDYQLTHFASADILTTPALLMQAYIAYRRQG